MPAKSGHVSPKGLDERASLFYFLWDRVSLAAAGYTASLFNTLSTYEVQIERILVLPWQFAAAAGAVQDMYLALIDTAQPTGGSALTASNRRRSVTLDAGIVARSLPTGAVTEKAVNPLVRRFAFHGGDVGTLASAKLDILATYDKPLFERKPGNEGIILRQNEGIAIRNNTATATGSVSILVEFLCYPT